MNFSQYREFFAALEHFKFVERTMPMSGGRYENDAEHSWNLAMLALTLAPNYPELSLEKCLQYALIHDLGELFVDGEYALKDVYLYDEEWWQTKKEKETAAIVKLLSMMPEETKKWFEPLYHSYEEKLDPESIFIYELDKIQPIILIFTVSKDMWKRLWITKEMLLEKKLPRISDRFGLKELLLEYVEAADKQGMFPEAKQAA